MGYKEHVFKEDLVQIGHNYNAESLNSEYHIHNFCEVYILVSGRVRYFINSKCYDMEAGDILLISDRDLHRAENLSGEPFERYTVHFDYQKTAAYNTEQTNLVECFEKYAKLGKNIARIPSHFIENYYRMLREFKQADEREGSGRDVLMYSYLLRFLVDTNDIYKENTDTHTRGNVIYSPQILKIMELVEQNLDGEITLDYIAEQMFMNKYHLSHYFKKHTGTTIYQYVLLKRITLAKSLLIKGENVADAGSKSGFNDYSNFIRSFKKIVGKAPGKYKKENTVH